MPVVPKVIKFNGQDIQEQTLDQFIAHLGDDHCVKLQVAELRETIASLQVENQRLLTEKAGLTEQMGELQNRLAKSQLQEKVQRSAIHKQYKTKQAALSAEINPPLPPGGL